MPAAARFDRRRRARPTASQVASSAFALLFLACGTEKPPPFEVHIKAESDPGKPLSGVRILSAGQEVGASNAAGTIKLALIGKPGDTVELATACPDGYASASAEPLSIILRRLAPGQVPEYQITCSPLIRSLVVAVRAEAGPNLPVEYLGKVVARTNAAGVAHAALRVAPGDPVRISLNTNAPEHADLRPQNPEYKVVMPPRDELVLFEQTFTRIEAPKPPKRRVRRNKPTRLVTQRYY